MSDTDPPVGPGAAAGPLEPTGVYNPAESASELVRVLDQYLADLQAGQTPDKAALLARHPDLAAELEDCLAGIEFVHGAAKPSAETPAQLGDFRIIREVGRGGMGVVYEAQQLSLKRKVALKVLRFGVTADPEVMQRFQREAETVAHLHHTNIVPIHAVGCERGVHYYAMQFIEGKSLAAVAAEAQQEDAARRISLERFQEVVRWILQAAEALAHAHQRGVIHRDIKPSNLILDPEGTVWLTDFGLAKRADEVTLTAAGILMGTPRYMSPEQAAAAKQPIDHRTDIYSLGATLYELATGKPVFDSQTHLFVGAERGWRVINGAAGNGIWPTELQLPREPISPTDPKTLVSGTEWQYLLEGYSEMGGYHETLMGQSPGLALPAADLDGDGRHDLVFASRTSPSFLAVSGHSGSILWWFRAAPNLPATHDATTDPIDRKTSSERAGVLGKPLLFEVGGEPVVVAVFVSWNGDFSTQSGKRFVTGPSYWIEAVAGKSGKSFWRTPLNPPELPNRHFEVAKQSQFPARLEIVQIDGQDTLLFHAKTTLMAFDMRTGKELWAYDVGTSLVEAPHVQDLDGDGQAEALFVFSKDSKSREFVLKSVALKSRETLWERPFLQPGELNREEWRRPGKEVAVVADLDGDGKPEVMTPVSDDWQKYGKHWFGVEVLSGTTGTPLWERRLWNMGYGMFGGSSRFPESLLVGPDLDGDGHRELFVAALGSIFQPPQADIQYLQVDALSGKDGRTLWRWRQQAATSSTRLEFSGRLQWWQTGADGWPQLVVPVSGAGGQPITYILAIGNGRLAHQLTGVAEPQVADLNNDGIPDLFHLTGNPGSRRLTVFKGLPPVDWRRPGIWQVAGDYDGDGVSDFREWKRQAFGGTALAARSGTDGRILWQTNVQPNENSSPARRAIDIDADGHGTPAIVLLENLSSNQGYKSAVSAFSGQDGRRLWTAGDFGLMPGSTSTSGGGPHMEYSYPQLDQRDLDGDGRPEILVAGYIDQSNRIKLAALANKDGQLLWKIPIETGAYTGSSLIDRQLWHDIDGDGVLDIALWVPKSIDEHGFGVGIELHAISGRDGSSLWKEVPVLAGERYSWPRPAMADLDGDGIAEVVVTTFDSNGRNELAVLDARTGARKWSWTGPPHVYNNNLLPPLLVKEREGSQRMVCLGTMEPSADVPPVTTYNIIVFDPQGNIRHRIPLQGISYAVAWTAHDVDGDGDEELLYTDDGQVHAFQVSAQRELWKTPERSYGLKFDQLRPGREREPGTLVAWSGSIVRGLNLATGEDRWRCELPNPGNSQLAASLSPLDGPDGRPLVVSQDFYSKYALAQRAWPTNAVGGYMAPTTKPVTYAEFVDPNRFRPLPWSNKYEGQGLRVGWIEMGAVLIFLGTLLNWFRQGRWRLASCYLFLACVTAFIIATLLLRFAAAPLEANESYAWTGWYWILIMGTGVVGSLTAVIAAGVWLVKRLWRLIRRSKTAS